MASIHARRHAVWEVPSESDEMSRSDRAVWPLRTVVCFVVRAGAIHCTNVPGINDMSFFSLSLRPSLSCWLAIRSLVLSASLHLQSRSVVSILLLSVFVVSYPARLSKSLDFLLFF